MGGHEYSRVRKGEEVTDSRSRYISHRSAKQLGLPVLIQKKNFKVYSLNTVARKALEKISGRILMMWPFLI